MISLVHDEFVRSATLGLLTVAVISVAAALTLRGVLMELRAFRSLQQVNTLKLALARSDLSLDDAKTICRLWLMAVSARLLDPEAALKSLEAAQSIAELKANLRNRVVGPLDDISRQLARVAAMQGGALVAIVPSPALDGLLSGLRGLALMRRVAQVYGLRPGIVVTASLFSRVAWTAASVSGVDLLAQTAADQILHGLPVIKHIAGAIPGTGLTALRLYRLGVITAQACSPLAEN